MEQVEFARLALEINTDRPKKLPSRTSVHNGSSVGVWLRPGAVRSELPSAALDVLLNDHAAVSEEGAGQRLQERPRVGARVKCLYVAKRWTLAAHDASRGVDLTIQDNCAVQQGDRTGFNEVKRYS